MVRMEKPQEQNIGYQEAGSYIIRTEDLQVEGSEGAYFNAKNHKVARKQVLNNYTF